MCVDMQSSVVLIISGDLYMGIFHVYCYILSSGMYVIMLNLYHCNR